MTYHEREQYIYDQLVKSQNETGFYFSLRVNGSRNARRDIFIGTEKSNYIKFSVWNVPIGFAGSSGNFMDFCIFNKNNDRWSYKFESSIPKNVTGDQNKLSLAFLKELVDRLSNEFSDYKHYVTQDHNKMYFISIEHETGYRSFEKLTAGLLGFMSQLIPIVDSLMDQFKLNNPEWNAHRYKEEEWDKFNKDYQRRLKKYPIEVLEKEETEEEEDSIELVNPIKPNHPSNQILYGPPGTGKTYSSITLALDILGIETKDKTRSEIISEYEEYRKRGQIAFTTFHQSMAYEDFIEGIKPSLDDIENDVSYEVCDGILKSMAKLAIQEYVKWGDHDNMSFETRYDKLLELVNDSDSGYVIKSKTGNNLILEEVTARENIKVKHENGQRNYIVSKTRLEKLFHGLPKTESISNINKAIRNIIGGSNATSYWAVNEVLRKMEGEKGEYKVNPKLTDLQLENIIKEVDWAEASDLNVDRYVLIIDEVNRGNVSAIFGELITLLEDDKRLDQTNRIVLKLPYSKTDFGLPSNLHIVATMNTADRSVEALDTALRRRFSFKEILPDVKVISSQPEEMGSDDIEGISLIDILKTINRRIELLIDKDHIIGHSYFLKINDQEALKDTFKNKIIPLLQEYFYNDYEKLSLVLGDGFIARSKVEFSEKEFAGEQNQLEVDLPEYTYLLRSINKDFDILSALRLLLNLPVGINNES